MKKISLLVLIFFFGNLSAEIKDHLKIIDDKSDIYLGQLKNIDFIYLINLDQRPEKFAYCLSELLPFGIQPYRFSAVNGWQLSLQEINDLGVKYTENMVNDLWGTCYLNEDNFKPHHEIMNVIGRNYFCHTLARGSIGILLSHLSVLQDAYDSGYETIWVMEDDIKVIKDPTRISTLISQLDKITEINGWDILFTDQDTKDKEGNYVSCYGYAKRPDFSPDNIQRFSTRTQVTSEFIKIGSRYGAYSMILRRSGIEKILNFYKKHGLFLPYDMEYYLPNDIVLYTVTDDIVSTLPYALSDNGGENYNNKSPYIFEFEGLHENLFKSGRYDLIARIIEPDDVILEAGGFDGGDTIHLAKLIPDGKIICFEPNPARYIEIQSKTKSFTNVATYPLALGEMNEMMDFYLCHGKEKNSAFDGASSLLPPTKETQENYQGPIIQVPAIVLDDWCREYDQKEIDFMWLDLGGFELQFFKSSPQILSKVKAVYVKTNFYNFRVGMTLYKDLRFFLEKMGFKMLSHGYYVGHHGNAIFVRSDLFDEIVKKIEYQPF